MIKQDPERLDMLLLILRDQRQVYRLHPLALEHAQATRRELRKGYEDAFVLDRDGALRRIEDIEVLGPFGESTAGKLFSLFVSSWRIRTRLSKPLAWDFEDVARVVADCVRRGGFDDEEDPSHWDALAQAVTEASSARELFDVLEVCEPHGALDSL